MEGVARGVNYPSLTFMIFKRILLKYCSILEVVQTFKKIEQIERTTVSGSMLACFPPPGYAIHIINLVLLFLPSISIKAENTATEGCLQLKSCISC